MKKMMFNLLVLVGLLAGCASQPRPTPPDTAATTGVVATTAPSPAATAEPIAALPAPSPAATAEPTAAAPTAAAPTLVPTAAPAASADCTATAPDAEGPFYVPNAPERSSVGQGHVLSGVVRSTAGCASIANAQIEFWLAGPDGEYGDAYRATLYADTSGAYRFESNFPPPYAGRPSHIHIRVSAPGYQTLITQYYPAAGQTAGSFDLVLVPNS